MAGRTRAARVGTVLRELSDWGAITPESIEAHHKRMEGVAPHAGSIALDDLPVGLLEATEVDVVIERGPEGERRAGGHGSYDTLARR